MKLLPKFHLVSVSLVLGWLVVFVFLPNLLISIISLLSRDETQLLKVPFTMSNYARLADPLYLSLIRHSLFIAISATSCCLLLGYPMAFIIARAPRKKQQWLLLLLIVPFWTNSLIRIYGLKLLIGAKGLINSLLIWLGLIGTPFKIMYTEWAVILGLTYILLPFMILPLYSNIEKLDNSYLEAAKDLGAGPMQRFIRIILPLTANGIAGGSMLVFLPALGMFYVADIFGGAKNLLIGNVIKDQFLNARDWPFGSAISLALMACMSLLMLFYYSVTKLLHQKRSLHD